MARSICFSELLNSVVALKKWVLKWKHQFVHLFCDNATALAISQAGRGRDPFLQADAKDVWLMCAIWEITLAIVRMAGESLTDTADALSHWHVGQVFKGRASLLVKDRGVRLLTVPDELFPLSEHL